MNGCAGRDGGAVSVELTLLAPVMIALLCFVVGLGRIAGPAALDHTLDRKVGMAVDGIEDLENGQPFSVTAVHHVAGTAAQGRQSPATPIGTRHTAHRSRESVSDFRPSQRKWAIAVSMTPIQHVKRTASRRR